MAISKKKNEVGRITVPESKLYYKAIVIKTAQEHLADTRNRTENPEIDQTLYARFIFDQGGKRVPRSKDSLFSKWCWENW